MKKLEQKDIKLIQEIAMTLFVYNQLKHSTTKKLWLNKEMS